MKKALVVLIGIAFVGVACSSGQMKVGEKKEIKDDNGNIVGELEQVGETTQKARFEMQDGVPARIVTLEEGEISSVAYDKDRNSEIESEVFYKGGEPEKVVLPPRMAEAKVVERKVTYVDLKKNNKRVHFNRQSDGSAKVGKIEDIPEEKEEVKEETSSSDSGGDDFIIE